jgi:hypothetical protein
MGLLPARGLTYETKKPLINCEPVSKSIRCRWVVMPACTGMTAQRCKAAGINLETGSNRFSVISTEGRNLQRVDLTGRLKSRISRCARYDN